MMFLFSILVVCIVKIWYNIKEFGMSTNVKFYKVKNSSLKRFKIQIFNEKTENSQFKTGKMVTKIKCKLIILVKKKMKILKLLKMFVGQAHVKKC